MPNEDDTKKHDQDLKIFRKLMSDVRPIKADVRTPVYKSKPKPRAQFTRQDEQAVLKESLEIDIDEIEVSAGETLCFQRTSIGRRTMRRLRRGQFSTQGEIDLHGMTVPEAKNHLCKFITESLHRGHTCVRIVHGKGLGSGGRGPVLKGKVNNWLRHWDHVIAFVSAKQVDGGTGALYVLLKKI